ncbi:MAG TPA: Asp-tRNA(Asn)/Glu-tRNA(Gln) amidotransferase subunit GatC [Cytophagales bacterium]|nr:Asp-tRNA(Asn)/Glu-tRNA(Gln) amidotransferase subunit GatC [Cytophagales bacterium]
MKVDKNTLRKIAHLARLEFDPKHEEGMIKSMTEILDWVEKLNEVDTENVEPLLHMSEEINVFREDEVRSHLAHERGLQNAPKKDSDYFRVPKVME